jgi:hypothetical protein
VKALIILCLCGLLISCFSGPSRKALKRQTIPPNLLGNWSLVRLGEEVPDCEVRFSFRENGKLVTSFKVDFEGFFLADKHGKTKIYTGIHHKIFYPGYEDCGVETTSLALALNYNLFEVSIKHDTLTLHANEKPTAILIRI